MDDLSQNKMAIAALFAALVEALDEKSNGLALSFARHLDETQTKLRENEVDHQGVLETLAWTRSFLRDDFDRTEPACVVYVKNWTAEEDQLPSSDKVQLATLDEAVRFWERLPTYDQQQAAVETASGHRLDAAALVVLAKRYKDRPSI